MVTLDLKRNVVLVVGSTTRRQVSLVHVAEVCLAAGEVVLVVVRGRLSAGRRGLKDGTIACIADTYLTHFSVSSYK